MRTEISKAEKEICITGVGEPTKSFSYSLLDGATDHIYLT